jgi:hypothetical protein
MRELVVYTDSASALTILTRISLPALKRASISIPWVGFDQSETCQDYLNQFESLTDLEITFPCNGREMNVLELFRKAPLSKLRFLDHQDAEFEYRLDPSSFDEVEFDQLLRSADEWRLEELYCDLPVLADNFLPLLLYHLDLRKTLRVHITLAGGPARAHANPPRPNPLCVASVSGAPLVLPQLRHLVLENLPQCAATFILNRIQFRCIQSLGILPLSRSSANLKQLQGHYLIWNNEESLDKATFLSLTDLSYGYRGNPDFLRSLLQLTPNIRRISLDLHHNQLLSNSAGSVIEGYGWQSNVNEQSFALKPDSDLFEEGADNSDAPIHPHRIRSGSETGSGLDLEVLGRLEGIIVRALGRETGKHHPTFHDTFKLADWLTTNLSGQLPLRTLQDLCAANVDQDFILPNTVHSNAPRRLTNSQWERTYLAGKPALILTSQLDIVLESNGDDGDDTFSHPRHSGDLML